MSDQQHRRDGERRKHVERRLQGENILLKSNEYHGPERRNNERRSEIDRRH